MYRRIRDMREDRDLYQKDLAEYLRCSQVCYSYYEMGKRDIPTDVLIRLADFYGTSVDYLLGFKEAEQKRNARHSRAFLFQVSPSSRLASRE